MSKTALLTLFVVVLFQPVFSQKIENMKKMGKSSIVKQAIEYLKKEGVATSEIAKKQTKVVAYSDKSITVYFYMGFKYDTMQKIYETYEISVTFSENSTHTNCLDYEPNIRKYMLTKEDERKICLALDKKDFKTLIVPETSYTIKEKPTYFEVLYQSDDAAWCYQIDKKTRKIHELWHEHPERMSLGGYEEIKD